MRRLPPLLVVALLAGCWTPGSCAPCPDKTEVERDWQFTSNCLPDAGLLLRVSGLSVNNQNDCQAGCFSTATAHVEVIDGGPFATGSFSSSCGSDPGTLTVNVNPQPDGGGFSCSVELNRVGQDVFCGNGCVARFSEP